MKASLLLLSIATFLTGCAALTEKQIAAVRAVGVSPHLVNKLEHDRIIAPEDLIELRRHRVSDSIPIRYLDEVGVDYLVQRNDIKKLHNGGVSPVVVDELIIASQRFAERQVDHPFAWTVGVYAPYYPWYGSYGLYDYAWPYCY